MILMKKLCYVSFSIFAFVLIYFVNDVRSLEERKKKKKKMILNANTRSSQR